MDIILPGMTYSNTKCDFDATRGTHYVSPLSKTWVSLNSWIPYSTQIRDSQYFFFSIAHLDFLFSNSAAHLGYLVAPKYTIRRGFSYGDWMGWMCSAPKSIYR